jgi:hypothetical protein
MPEIYKYIYTQISVFGSLPTHKVLINSTHNKTKLIFADNTFVYGAVSDWAVGLSGLIRENQYGRKNPSCF